VKGQNRKARGKPVTGYVLRVTALALLGLPIAYSPLPSAFGQESVVIRAVLAKEPISDDPAAPAWSAAPVSEFPLSPQVHWPVRIGEVTVKSVKVRARHDGRNIAILLEYADPTEDPHDAAALEFMVGDTKAHFAHGQPMAQVEGGPVNIWYWKNKDGKVLDMNAKGFGTLKVQEGQEVTGKALYQNGAWKVVFLRTLSTAETEHDVQIKPGEFLNVAFAIWDGKKLEGGDIKEKGSQKAVSSWWYLRAEPKPDYTVWLYVALGIGLTAGVEFVIIRKLRKKA
jgi:DMSO reductase family type II enzyme heme b subunit